MQDFTQALLTWDAGIPSDILTAMSNACPCLKLISLTHSFVVMRAYLAYTLEKLTDKTISVQKNVEIYAYFS